MLSRPIRRTAGSLWLGLAVALVAPAVVADVRLAVVDTQRVVLETEEGLRASATLKQLFDKRQQESETKQKEMLQERDDIEKQRGIVSAEALAKRAEKWQREMMALQQSFVEYNKELQQKQTQLTNPIINKTIGVIRRIAIKEGYDLVMDKQATPYFRADLDLTDRVITTYNQGGDAVEPAAEPQRPAAPALPGPLAPPSVPPVSTKR
jgi:outer membrane protein